MYQTIREYYQLVRIGSHPLVLEQTKKIRGNFQKLVPVEITKFETTAREIFR